MSSCSEEAVAIVVDPGFGESIRQLSARMHVWVVDTESNRAVAEAIWGDGKDQSALGLGVTTFQWADGCAPEEVLASMLATIEEHHPKWSHVEIYGASLTPRLLDAFREFGFDELAQAGGGISGQRLRHWTASQL